MKPILISQLIIGLCACFDIVAADPTNALPTQNGQNSARNLSEASVQDTNRTSAVAKVPVTSPDPIDHLVQELSASHGLWQNGVYPMIDLPETASPDEVISKTFEMTGFDKGHVKNYKILKTREVHITGSLPDLYTAALIETDFGQKIVLFQHQRTDWWARVYDANLSRDK